MKKEIIEFDSLTEFLEFITDKDIEDFYKDLMVFQRFKYKIGKEYSIDTLLK